MMMITTADSIGGSGGSPTIIQYFGVGGMIKRAKEAWTRRLLDDFLLKGENRSMTTWNQSIGQQEATTQPGLNRTRSRRIVMPISGKDFSTIQKRKRKTSAESLMRKQNKINY